MSRVGETTITGKNQISLPAQSLRELGWVRGDGLLVEIVEDNMLLLIRKPRSAKEWVEAFSGKLGDVFGGSRGQHALPRRGAAGLGA